MVICREICQSCEASKIIVHESWSVDQRTTTNRKVSYEIVEHNEEGKMQEGDTSPGGSEEAETSEKSVACDMRGRSDIDLRW